MAKPPLFNLGAWCDCEALGVAMPPRRRRRRARQPQATSLLPILEPALLAPWVEGAGPDPDSVLEAARNLAEERGAQLARWSVGEPGCFLAE